MARKHTPMGQARSRLDTERKWMRDRGRLPDYIKRYGSKYDPDHTGDGGEDIYAADMAILMAAERAYHEVWGEFRGPARARPTL
jgi:hypothetical protein